MVILSILSVFNPLFLWRVLANIAGYFLFLFRGTCAALGDFWVLYVHTGRAYQQPRFRVPKLAGGDLVLQLATQSLSHSRLCVKDEILHLNESFLDRGLWRGLSEASAAPSVIVTGVSYGGIGFYTALHVMLCGANVHGIVRNPEKGEETEKMMQVAVNRQCRLHKEWRGPGRVGRIMLHTCDMGDTVAVSQLADKLISDPNIRVIVCVAGPVVTPLRLSPQNLEEQFATHHVGHSLLVLRLLQHRLSASSSVVPAASALPSAPEKGAIAEGKNSGNGGVNTAAVSQHYGGPHPPPWRIIVAAAASSAAACPTDATAFHRWANTKELWWRATRFSCYDNAKMCELLFAFALARHVQADRQLAPYCTVNVLHPGPARSRALLNSKLPFRWLADGNVAALLRLTPVIASLYVVDLCLSRRHEQTSGHFFRMGEDQSEYHASMLANPAERRGFFRNSTLWPGIPGPRVALSTQRQDWLWNATLDFFESQGLIEPKVFRH